MVIGSTNSSNTQALAKLASELGCPRVFRVNRAEELPDDLEGTVGMTAGASAPEELVQEVIAYLSPSDGVTKVEVTQEEEYFPPPRQLRELLTAIAAFGSVSIGGTDATSIAPDRGVDASDVLASMTV